MQPPSPKLLFLTSGLPFMAGLLCDGILCLTELENQGNPLLGFIKQAKDLSYGVYSSFMSFLVVMMILHLVIQILKVSFHQEASTKVKKGNSFTRSLLGYALAYSTLYFLYTVLQTQVEKASPVKILQNFEFQGNDMKIIEGPPSRILEEISNPLKVKEDKKIKTFPLGKVLGSLNIDASSAVFSHDETLLFVSRASYFGISVVDVSNWENPRVIQDSKIAIGTKPSKASLLLSPDEKTLFASNMENLALFNLNDLNSISYKLTYQGFEIPGDSNVTFEASLALSTDGTRLFASGYEFQVFDVLKKGAEAKLVKAELPQEEKSYFSTVAVSVDGQSLFLLNGAVLEIYDITDVDKRELISSVITNNMPHSFIQSKDGKILTLIGFEKGTNKVVIEKVDVSNVRAPLSIKTFPLNIESFSTSFGLRESPKGTYLSFTVKEGVSGDTKMMVFDSLTERLLEDTQNLISKAKSLLFASDETNVMAVYEESILTIQLYQKYPNDRIFTISKDTFAQVSTVPRSSNKILKEFSTSNKKFLLSVDEMKETTGSRFTFIDISNRSEINSFLTDNNPVSVSITNDAKTLSVSFKSSIILYDISDMKFPKILGSKTFYESCEVVDAVFTSDGKTCFAAISSGADIPELGSFDLTVFDLSDPKSIKEIDSLSQAFLWFTPFKTLLALSKDDKTLFMVHTDLRIFDVSARKVTKSVIGDQTIESVTFVPSSISLSPNEKILIIKKEDLQSSSLHIFDVSDRTSPRSMSVFALPKTKVLKRIQVGFSPDGKFAYTEGIHGGQASLLVLNLTYPNSPVFQSVIQAEGGSVDNFIISDDGRVAYLASNSESKISLINLDVSNTVFLGTESFRLGEKSSTDVMVLKQNNDGNYVPLGKNYRFVKASFFSTKIVQTGYSTESTFTPFPYWMTFEKKTGNFVLEPKRQRDLGAYTLYSVFSTQLNHSSFWTITNNTDQIRALLGSLVSLDYLDNQLYVTENLDTFDNFYYTGVESEKVYKILKESCFETFTGFDIVPSLEIVVNSKKKLEIQTPSDSGLKIEITLMDKSFQFLNKQYGPLVPLITEDKTKLAIEGSIDDVNDALKKLAVNSEVNESVCEGKITIWDRLNPSLTKTLKNLSSYFESNEAPRVNDGVGFAIQEQLNSKVYETGKEFSLVLLKNTFIDKHSAETLRFTLTSDNKERSSVSDWLTFNDGILKGTPKKEVMKRSVNLILTISNEFKKVEIPFTINIKLSPMFILELLMKYSPYILTVVSIWIFANRIYNVLKKDKYRHCKDFYLSAGQEITSQDIYPIRFLGQEGEESDLIWKHLKKEGLDKSKLTGEIKKIVEKLPEKDLPLWKKGSALSKKLIHQLVLNHLTLWLIDLEDEKETKRIYEEEIEDHLMDLVKWDDEGYCDINESKLNEILKNSNRKEEEGLEVGLILHRGINVDLLKDVMIAKAMKCQSISKNAVFTHVIIKQEFPGNWIKRFFKLNLQHAQTAQNGQNMIYGINYEIKNGVLYFYGVAEEMFCEKTIVLQITDLRHKILKEIWIHGGGIEVSQGNNYEIL